MKINEEILTALADGGSAINLMREDIAQRHGYTINRGPASSIKLADGSTSQFAGTIEDVPITVGTCTVCCTFFILSKANYEILLGRPWECAVEAMWHNHVDGGATGTLRCPNTGKVTRLAMSAPTAKVLFIQNGIR